MNENKWFFSTVNDCLDNRTIRSTLKCQAKDYKPIGTYPIVDQGQELISGWSDDPNGLISDYLPLIVFGDHTRILKFIDFPFIRGADGTQLMKPKQGIDPLFFFYACKSIDVPNRGYNRHFSLLKERTIALPPKYEQTKIAKILAEIENNINFQKLQLKTSLNLKNSVMQTLFEYGIQSLDQKETDFGLVPENWNIGSIGDHFLLCSGGTPSRNNLDYWHQGTIPWVKSTDINYCKISSTSEYISDSGFANSSTKLLKPGTILMAMYGQGITRGKVAILEIEATCNQACAAMYPLSKFIESKFLYYFLTYHYQNIRRFAHGGQQQNLNLEIIRTLPIAYPDSLPLQNQIVRILESIDQKIDIHRKKKNILENLFKITLQKLMTAEIRVANLDLSILESLVENQRDFI